MSNGNRRGGSNSVVHKLDRVTRIAVAALAAITVSGNALAADPAASAQYPSKPIRFIVPFTPGALNDLLARLIGEQLGTRLGQRVIVDNRPGAGTVIGSDLVAKSNPDGHTLLLASAPLAINPSLYARLPFDATKDLAGVTQIGSVPFVLVSNPQSAAASIKELVALARAKPGQLSYGATVAGQLMVEMFKSTAKIDIVLVPYKGLAPAMIDVMGGRIFFTLGTYSSLGPHVKAGRLRALAVTSKARTRIAPDVPTIAEAGYKDYDATTWYGVAVAGATPRALVSRLHSEIVAIAKHPEMERRLVSEGVDLVASRPEEFDRLIKTETVRWGRVIKEAGIKVEQE
jgi:tripartite-type tricarboxylate transporter receptor subunit TctC